MRNVRPGQMIFGYVWQDAKLAIPRAIRQRYTFLQKAANHCKTLSSVPLAFPCLSSSIPFSRLFLCSSFLFLSSSFPFTDLRFTSTKPSDRPPKCDRYPLLGSNAKTLSLDNGSHIHTTCFQLFLHTKWFMDFINCNYWGMYNEHDNMTFNCWTWWWFYGHEFSEKNCYRKICDMGQTAPHISVSNSSIFSILDRQFQKMFE